MGSILVSTDFFMKVKFSSPIAFDYRSLDVLLVSVLGANPQLVNPWKAALFTYLYH